MSSKSRRFAVTLGLGIAAVVLGSWWIGRDAGTARPISQPSPPGDTRKSPLTDIEVFASEPVEGERTPVQLDRHDSAPIEAEAKKHESEKRLEPSKILLEGTIVVVDPSGQEHPFENGSMSLVLWEGSTGHVQEVAITDGRWLARVPSGVGIGVDDVQLGGRRAVAEMDRDLYPVPASGFLELQARWPATSVLHVRSADLGIELDQVEALVKLDLMSNDLRHPSRYAPSSVVIKETQSPIEISSSLGDRVSGREVLYARAPGYAWGRIELDLDRGGDRVLHLHPGGSLLVLLGEDAPPQASLRLREKNMKRGRPFYDAKLGRDTEIEIPSLLPGRYRVSVEMGDWFRRPVVLGADTVEVVVGSTASVHLDLDPLPVVEKVHLRGTVALAEGWTDERVALSVELLSRPADGRRIRKHFPQRNLPSADGMSLAWTFDMGRVPTGRYEFEVNPPFYLEARDIDSEEEAEVRIEVPAVVAVRVLDQDGEDVEELDSIYWHPKRPRGVTSGTLDKVQRDPRTGRYEFHAPQHPVVVSAPGLEFSGAATFHIGPGRNEVELEVSRTSGIIIVLRDGETILPWDGDWHISAREVGGSGRSNGFGGHPRGKRIKVSRPGLYRFSLPEIDGYAPVPEQEVMVPEHEYVEHAVELERLP